MNAPAASASPQLAFLKPIWTALLGPPWLVSLAVFVVLAGVRFFVFLSSYPLQELFFLQTVAMWALPFLFLTSGGRRQIGLTERGVTPGAMLLSAFAGAVCGLALFAVGMALYGYSPNNWCISIRNYLHFEEMRGLLSPLELFCVYALPAVFFNPVGEELLYRGFIQESFARRLNPSLAILINSTLFAFVYLSVHGIWRDASGYHLRLGSAALALVLMACVGAVFNLCRRLSGSLWPSMAAHAGFNLALLGASIHRFFH
jgi:hypothetical protein